MTDRAVDPLVTAVIELRPKALKPRELLHTSFSMTDGTNRALVVGELQGVTTGAGQMAIPAGKADAGGIIVARMAHEARQPGVIRVAVLKVR